LTTDVPCSSHLKLAIECELIAERGDVSQAVDRIGTAAREANESGNTLASAWLLMKRAEILCTDSDPESAWQTFEQYLLPLLDRLDEQHQPTIRRNFSFVGVVIGRDTSLLEYYGAVDRSRNDPVATQSLLAAEDASRQRRHFESLPPLWRELNRAYLDGDWGARRRAHARFASETLAVGWIHQAVYHAIRGGNREALVQLAEWLVKWRDPAFLDETLRCAISSSLCEHAHLAAQILGLLADVIPDDRISAIVEYLLASAKRASISRHNEQPLIACWEALHMLSFRLSDEEAKRVVERAIDHPFADAAGFGRKAIIRTVTSCIRRAPAQEWAGIVDRCVGWAKESRWDGDYDEVLKLLEAISAGDNLAKQRIADAIAPSGSSVGDLRLMARLSSFGRHATLDQLRKLVVAVASHLPNQVWVGQPPAPRFPLGGMGTVTHPLPDGTVIQAEDRGGIFHLAAIAAQNDLLDGPTLGPLINPICDLLSHPFNLITSRMALCVFINSVRTALDRDAAQQMCDVLMPFASGRIRESSPLDVRIESTASRFQVQGYSLGEQRAEALHTLALLQSAHPDVNTDLESILETAMLDSDAAVRASACAALVELQSLTAHLTYSLVAALQDSDNTVSLAAYDAVIGLWSRGMLRELRPVIIACSARGAASAMPAIRRQVARLVSKLQGTEPNQSEDPELSSVVLLLSGDQNYSVRSILSGFRNSPSEYSNTKRPDSG
jgi:hypothetical protein